MMQEADEYLPQLRERALQLREELERERAEVAVIEKCDQAVLRDWRDSIIEQQSVSPLTAFLGVTVGVGMMADICDRIQVDSKIEEVRDKISKLEEYRTQLDGLTSIHTAHETAIAQARRWCDQYTKSDIVNIRRKSRPFMILCALGGR